MNAISVLLRVIAIVGAAAAGYFYYTSKNLLTDEKTQLAAANSSLSAANGKLAEAQKTIEADAKTADDLKKAQDDLATATKASDDLKKQVTDAQNTLKVGKAALDKANADNNDLRKNIAILNNKADQLDRILANNPNAGNGNAGSLTPPPSTPGPVVAGGNLTPPPGNNPTPSNFTSTPTPTKIVAIDPMDGLLVLGVGSNGGIDNNAQLTLQKSGNKIVEVRVTEIHPDFAVATILSTSGASLKEISKTLGKQLPQGQDVDYVRVK